MTRARADSTSVARERWLERIKKDPGYVPPRYDPTCNKPVGSKKWMNGGWVPVKAGDDDAATC
jgi:hypothetical protein